jgi:hypothetical protein
MSQISLNTLLAQPETARDYASSDNANLIYTARISRAIWLLRQLLELGILHSLGCIPIALYLRGEPDFTYWNIFVHNMPTSIVLKLMFEAFDGWNCQRKTEVESVSDSARRAMDTS